MRRAIFLLVSFAAVLAGGQAAFAQNLRLDYIRNVPRQYGPYDPWEVGIVMRNQMGHGGLFYNCDCEEHKRLSPYIRWEQQPTVCCPHGHCRDLHQQLDEVRQRVRTGSCRQCEFRLCQECTSSPTRPLTDCPQAGCATCAEPADNLEAAPAEPTPAEPTPVEPSPAPTEPTHSAAWLRKLYSR